MTQFLEVQNSFSLFSLTESESNIYINSNTFNRSAFSVYLNCFVSFSYWSTLINMNPLSKVIPISADQKKLWNSHLVESKHFQTRERF